jgi:hypothetical protein
MKDLFFTIKKDAETCDVSSYILKYIKQFSLKNYSVKMERGMITVTALYTMLRTIEQEEHSHMKTIERPGLVKMRIHQYLKIESDEFEIKLKNF